MNDNSPKAESACPTRTISAIRRPAKLQADKGQFKPVRTQRIFEEICQTIRQKLVSRDLSAGDRLPPERELAEQLAVSRTAVREALRSLEIAGIVELRNGRHGGAFITESGADQVKRSFQDMLDFGRVPLATLLEARMLVMDVVVRTAAERAGPSDLAALERNIAETIQLTKAGQHEARTLKAVEFNTLLASATGNQVLTAMVDAMASVIRGFVVIAGPPPHDPLVASRRKLLKQLAAQEADAACGTMRRYLVSLTAHLLAAEAARKAPA